MYQKLCGYSIPINLFSMLLFCYELFRSMDIKKYHTMMLTRRAGYGILRRRKQKWIVAVKKCSIHGFLRMDEDKN